MKIAFTVLSSLLFISTAFAYDVSRLTVTTAGKWEFELIIDNKRYTSQDNSIFINDLQPGQHSIRIYRKHGENLVAGIFDSRNNLIYSSTIFAKASYHIDIMINRFGKALVDELAFFSVNGGNSNGKYLNNNPQSASDMDCIRFGSLIENRSYGKLNDA
jgi:hypothetical protein